MQGGEGSLPQAGSKPGGYVPPSKRGGGGGEGDSMRRREENSVRVTNLSEDTREDDLRVRPRMLQSHQLVCRRRPGQEVLFVCPVLKPVIGFRALVLSTATLSQAQTSLQGK